MCLDHSQTDRFTVKVGEEWKSFGSEADKVLKHFFRTGEKQISIVIGGTWFEFDFASMVQRDAKTKVEKRIYAPEGWIFGRSLPKAGAPTRDPRELMASLLSTMPRDKAPELSVGDALEAPLGTMPLGTMPLGTIPPCLFPHGGTDSITSAARRQLALEVPLGTVPTLRTVPTDTVPLCSMSALEDNIITASSLRLRTVAEDKAILKPETLKMLLASVALPDVEKVLPAAGSRSWGTWELPSWMPGRRE